jgi:sigma-E factor negative regulatory protein RseA
MNDRNDEILSAFVDDETSEFESRLMIKELAADEEKRIRWERYHLIRDTLQRNLPLIIDKNFCHCVRVRIQAETSADIVSKAPNNALFQWLKPIGAMALVSVAAVLGVWSVRIFVGPNSAVNPPLVAHVASQSGQEVKEGQELEKAEKVQATMAWPTTPRATVRMNSYLVNHAEYAASQSVMPYARIVTYDDMSQR